MHRRFLFFVPRPPGRDERGATAVMFALLSLVLLGTSAIAVDLGQVYAKRASVQTAADLAVVAAAAKLDGSNACSAAAVGAAEQKLTQNWIDQSNDPISLGLNTPSLDDGYLQCTGWKVRLWAPKARVDFGLARAVSSTTGVDVGAEAEASVFSPKTGVMPAFAVGGCDYGYQTVLDPPGSGTFIPTLPQAGSPNQVQLSTTAPTSTPVNTNTSLTVNSDGSGPRSFSGVNRISFSRQVADGGQMVTLNVPSAGNPTVTRTATQIVISQVPAAVITSPGVWWVRVSTDGGTTWSNPNGDALPFQVGDAILTCAGSNSGNFGTVTFPRTNPSENSDQGVAYNFMFGLEYSLSKLLGTNGYCTPGVNGAIAPPNNSANCVQSAVGLAANSATQGLISGKDGNLGRLDAKPTQRFNCSPQRTGADLVTPPIKGRTYEINNDTLSCFLSNASLQLSTVTSPTYSGGEAFDRGIFESPRFFYVPVFAVQATNGNSNRYSIVDFRAGFITGDQGGSTKAVSVQDPDTTVTNGIGFDSNGITTLKMVFFNESALPATIGGGETMPYVGAGTKVIVLTD